MRSHKKNGPDRFSRFDVYWIQIKKQTDRQAKNIFRDSNQFGTFLKTFNKTSTIQTVLW